MYVRQRCLWSIIWGVASGAPIAANGRVAAPTMLRWEHLGKVRTALFVNSGSFTMLLAAWAAQGPFEQFVIADLRLSAGLNMLVEQT